MKRRLEELLQEGKKRPKLRIKRSRSPLRYNCCGASDDETEESPSIKRMINSKRVPVVTKRCISIKKIDRSSVPSYIN